MSQLVLVQEEPRGPSQLVEIPVPSNGLQRVNFPDIQQLRSMADQKIVVKGIRCISAEVLVRGPITGQVTAPVAELQKMSLVIYCEGWEKAQFLPVLLLNDASLTAGGTVPHVYVQTMFNDWQNVDWSKSYIQFSNGVVSANSPYVLLLDVQYEKLRMDGSPIVGPS